MARQVQFRRGTTAQTNSFTGAVGEVTVDTDKDTVVVHDGSTAGGHPLPTSLANLGVTSTAAELNLLDGSSAGSIVNSKGVVYGSSGEVNATTLQVGGAAITSTPAELNVLDGIPATLTATELGYVDGVTSAIQTQLNAKGTVSSLSDLSITSTATELNTLDGIPATLTATELGYVDGVTSAIQTQLDAKQALDAELTELSTMASTTASALADLTQAEVQILDGATVSTAELNYVVGVTSAIQTQLDAKQALDAELTELATMGSTTASALADLTQAEVQILDGATVSTTELNLLDGVTATTAELNYVDGVTSAIQTQLDAKVGATYTGDVDITGELIVDSYNETYGAVTSSSNATTVNCEAGNAFSHTLTENTTFTFSNPPASGTAYSFSLEIIQDGSASGFTVTWPAAVDWPAATAPTLTATASAKDVFVFYTRDGGTNWYGFTAGQALG